MYILMREIEIIENNYSVLVVDLDPDKNWSCNTNLCWLLYRCST